MKRIRSFEGLESRRVLAYSFGQELIELPIENRSGLVMEVVDLNQDAWSDVVVGTSSSTIDILLGGEGDSFSLAASIVIGDPIIDIVLADLNGDLRDDVLVHTYQQIMPLVDRGYSQGEWLGYERGIPIDQANVYRLELGTLNADTYADIVYVSKRELKIRHGNGDGSFGDALTWRLDEGLFHDFDVGDVNSDRYDDIVATTVVRRLGGLSGSFIDTNGPMKILTNDQSGAFTEETAKVAEGITVELFDFNRDGHNDILAGSVDSSAEASGVFYGDGRGGFDRGISVGGRYRTESQAGTRAYAVQERPGHGVDIVGGLFFDDPRRAIGISPWKSGTTPHFIDLDQNGTYEVAGISENSLAVISDLQPSIFQTDEMLISAVPMFEQHMSYVGDFDDDGYVDLIWILDTSPQFTIGAQWGSAGGFQELQEFQVDVGRNRVSRSAGMYSGHDVNEDGIPDLLLESTSSGEQGTLALLGAADRDFTATFQQSPWGLPRPPLNVRADIDGDGFADQVSILNSSADAVLFVQRGIDEHQLESQGVHYGVNKFPDTSGYQNEYIQLADATGDGVLDLLYYDTDAKHITVLPGVSQYLPGDVNRDGEVNVVDLDLLAPLTHSTAVAQASSLLLDMTGDQKVDEHDLDHWIEVIAKTRRGDANLDGQVDFADFLKLSASFGSNGATWNDGDFNGDREVNFDDFLLLSANFGFDSEK